MLIALGMGLSGRELDKMMASRHGTHQVGTDEVTTPTSNAAGDAVSAMLIGEPEEEEEEKPSYRSNASVVPQDGTILSCAGSNDASSSGGPSVTQLPPAKPPSRCCN